MKYYSKYNVSGRIYPRQGFTLTEILAALIILALICSSAFMIIDRCVKATTDTTLKMQAFKVARENMESLLSKRSAKEKVDYGNSKTYPHINWETVVETFDEPVKSQMWVRAVCSAYYIDSKGQEQKVELSHWLTNISRRQMVQILEQMEQRKEILKEQLVPSSSEAAAYANVSPETIQMWLDNGMPTASNGTFIKDALDLYKNSQGYPSGNNVSMIEKMYKFMMESAGEEITTAPPQDGEADTFMASSRQGNKGQMDMQGRVELIPGYTEQELSQMSFAEVWELLMEYQDSIQ